MTSFLYDTYIQTNTFHLAICCYIFYLLLLLLFALLKQLDAQQKYIYTQKNNNNKTILRKTTFLSLQFLFCGVQFGFFKFYILFKNVGSLVTTKKMEFVN